MISSKKDNPAFTLVELLTAMTIFATFIAVISSSYIFLMRSLRDAQITKNVTSEVMQVVQSISDNIRVDAVDYDCYNGNSSSLCGYIEAESSNQGEGGILKSSYLVLKNYNETGKIIYRIKDGHLQVLKQSLKDDLWVAGDGFENSLKEPFGFKDLMSSNVNISDGKFLIAPYQNPFNKSAESDLRFQPQVTIKINFQTSSQVRKEIKVPIETTISTRIYGK
ncbi:hypothetical protein A2307_00275 [Candidatus Peregrinibacteria bacterium RIFOXYB2_FULL_33_20]|nr:MAG: hypothetical protein A2307_00275 [Candidatus Peregrinibacteria bacterium RIFOXYB2_FULL_33_20]